MSAGDRPSSRVTFLGAPYDLAPVEVVFAALAARRDDEPFRYVATPNVDHLVRLRREPRLLPLYANAWQSWCDSHIVRRLGFLFGLRLPHLNGTDVVERIFAEILQPGDRIAVIAARPSVLDALRTSFPQLAIAGHCPPMGFIEDDLAVGASIRFARDNRARFLFIAVGAPQSERLAHRLMDEGVTGTGLCVGAAMEFVSGAKARAPKAMQNLGFEWLHRLWSEPRRLWRRYVLALGPLFALVLREAVIRGTRGG